MNTAYPADSLGRERPDPVEASSLTWINVPLVLLSLFLGFGMTYLGLRTPDTRLAGGDTRSAAAADAAPAISGDKLYSTHCQACHQPDGGGLGNAFPPLDGSEWVAGPPEKLAGIVLHGINGQITVKGQKFQGAMPTFKDKLSSAEIAAVATFVRGAWSNRAEPVSTEIVERVRKETAGRSGPYQGEADLGRP